MSRAIKVYHAAPSAPEEKNAAVGKPQQHESAEKQVSGEAPFVDDYPTQEECLHAAVILSKISKGEIESLDLHDVQASPGVVAVYCYDDIPGSKDIGILQEGDPLLCDGKIKFHNQPVALVLAHCYAQAWKAAQKAHITYKEETACVDYSCASGQAHLLPSGLMGVELDDGDFKDAEIVIDGNISIAGQEHFYLEGQISLAEPTEDGGIFLRSSTQNPTELQIMVARVLNIPFNKVIVDTRRIGGGFGGKETNATQWGCLAGLAASLTGKMVKLRLPRAVDMAITGKRHPFLNKYRLAASADGVLKSCKLELNALCGHSPDLSEPIMDRAMFHCDNAYYLGRAAVVGNHLKTDTVSNTALRGFGAPQAVLAIEKALQDLSIKSGQDSLDLRLKNLYRAGKDLTHYGMQVTQHDTLLTIIKTLEKSADYRKRREMIKIWNKRNCVIKKGLALTPVKFGISFTATHLNQAGALVHIYLDGSVQVCHGGTEMGQGVHTKIQQIVAQALGITVEQILVTSTRTDKVPNTSATAASSGSDLNGMAAYNAVNKIKQRLLEFAKTHYQLQQMPEISDGQLTAGTKKIAWGELIQQAYLSRISLSATGFYKTPKIWYNKEKAQGRPFYYFALGAACSEVTIDTLTGEMQVKRVDILHDAGNSLNPAIDIGQIEGGFIQGMGWLTTEELLWDKGGKLLSNTPMNYKIPTIADYPKQMNIALFVKSNPEHSIYRSKAIGEPPFLLAVSVWCAIYDAIASISHYKLAPKLNAPATGEQILTACTEQFSVLKEGEKDE